MFGPKIPVVAAVVGFVLSFLIGLFSGAAFPVFLFRAVIMAIFFAAVAVAVHLLIQRFLPELLGGNGTAERDQEQKTSGTVVDMTVGDHEDDPVLSFDNGGVFTGAGKPSFNDDELPASGADESESSVDEEFEEASGEFESAGTETAASDNDEKANADIGGSVTEPTAADSAAVPSRQKPKGSAAGLDVLPDLQDFIPEKIPESDDETDDDVPVEPVVHGFSVPDITTDVVETETMAKAIRTILSKDN